MQLKLIYVFTTTYHLSLNCAKAIQTKPLPLYYLVKIYFNIILPSMPMFSKWSLSLQFSC